MKLSWFPIQLELKHRFSIAGNSRTMTPAMLVRLEYAGVVGYGEASMPPYLGETQESAAHFYSLLDFTRFVDPFRIDEVMEYLESVLPGHCAAKAAIDIALHDWIGKVIRMPMYRVWGLTPERTPHTSFTIGMDCEEVIRQKVKEAAPYSILKVKLGGENDQELIRIIRSESDKPLFVDANQGWKGREKVLEMTYWLQEQGVVLIEQPFEKSDLDSSAWLSERSPLPIIADESCQRFSDLSRLSGCFTGINIKLMKCTGLREAQQMIHAARALGMKVMLGCMTETSCAISAAAQLSPLVDWADLDGNLLIANDPFEGVRIVEGKIELNAEGYGIGVKLK